MKFKIKGEKTKGIGHRITRTMERDLWMTERTEPREKQPNKENLTIIEYL